MKARDNWFTEVCEECGTAFSLGIRGKLHEEQSPFQKIEVYDTEAWGHMMVIDGFVMLTQRDNFLYHEMMAHPVLFSHPAPRRVAIIGGGDCGTLREVLQHDVVERVTQIDIDERVTRIAERFFPELCERNDDPRAELQFIDGIRWMAEQPAGSLDVIIVDSTDPIGPGEVLFTEAFYRDCLNALDGHGLFVQQSESPLVHTDTIIRPMYERLLAAGFEDVHTLHFPVPTYPTGWWSATVASKDGPLAFRRAAEAEARPFDTRYYTAEVHRAAFALPPFFRSALAGR